MSLMVYERQVVVLEDKKQMITVPEEEFNGMNESIEELKRANKDLTDSVNRLWVKAGELAIMGTAQALQKKATQSLNDLFKKEV